MSGHYCPSGSHEEIRCLSGTYQDETGQGSCKTCPVGYFCDNTYAPVVLFNSSVCPLGKTEISLCALGKTTIFCALLIKAR